MDNWKGYDVKRGDFSEAFKQYLRDRGLYFEPSSDGSWVHFEVKNADEAVDRFLKQYENRTRYVYEFPEGTTLQDINLAKRLGLKYLGKAKYRSGAEAYYIEGTLAELKNFEYEAFGDYELHPDYLCKADEFAGVKELKYAGYFEDAKYRKAKDKQMRLNGSRFKDSAIDSRIIAEAQKQIEIQEGRIYDCYDEEGNWKKPYSKMEQIEEDADAKASSLCYLIKAYGGIPTYSPGINGGRPLDYDGPIKAGGIGNYPVGLNNNSKIVKMCQQEIDRLIDEELSPMYYDEESDEEIDDWSTEEGYKKQIEIDEKVTALCYVIKAYGGTPEIGPGWDGLASDYNGPRN